MKIRQLIGDYIRERNPLDIEQITIPIKSTDSNFPSLRIAHVSDVHIPKSSFSPSEIANAVKKQNPDVIFLTGDMMDGRYKFDGPTIALLIILLKKIAPIYAISGNHERNNREYYKIWKTMLELRGVHFMDGKMTRFKKEGTTFIIVGMRYVSSKKIYEIDFSFLSKVDVAANECYLLLHHKPNIWRLCFPNDAPLPDIVFSGHAHGGQVGVPIINRGLFAPDQGLFPKYTSGLYQYSDGCYEVVSRGLASSTRPVRINNKPHLLIVEIVPKRAHGN